MSANNFQIAIVEDDPILREELARLIQRQGFNVLEANSANGLEDLMLVNKIDLLILDLNLPGKNGFQIAMNVRKVIPQIGIIMLTARTSLQDKIKGYEMGADIYLPKPTPVEELLAAIMTLKRRLTSSISEGWRLDSDKRILVTEQNMQIALTATETMLLRAFAHAPSRTLDTGVILDILAEKNDENETTKRAVENLISRLRKKIADSDKTTQQDKIIQSVWNQGYQLSFPIIVL